MDIIPIPKPVHKRKKKNNKFKTNAKCYCQKCGRTDAPIGRHHIIKRSQMGSGSDKNRIDLCEMYADTCHRKADAYEEGYKPKDLYWAKHVDKKREKGIAELLSP